MKIIIKSKGGPGSGNFDHAGIPGSVGGSAPTEIIDAATMKKAPATEKRLAKKKAEEEAAELAWKTKIPVHFGNNLWVTSKVTKMLEPEELESAMAQLKAMTEGKPVRLAIPSTVLQEYVLPEGRFKNQHETGTSGGTLDPSLRLEAERNVFGFGLTKPKYCPIYGYIDSPLGDGSQYGDVVVVFKPHVRKMTTVTVGDSFANMLKLEVSPSPIENLGPACLDHAYDRKSRTLQGDYIEAQIHGGLTLDDIDFIDLSHVYSDYKESIIPMLDARGIRYTE